MLMKCKVKIVMVRILRKGFVCWKLRGCVVFLVGRMIGLLESV